MQFLLAATRSSTSHSKIKNWLILAMRILAVLHCYCSLPAARRRLARLGDGRRAGCHPAARRSLRQHGIARCRHDESRREYALKLIAWPPVSLKTTVTSS